MVCTTLTVTTPTPTVTKVAGTTGFAKAGAYLNTDCQVPLSDVSAAKQEYGVKVSVANAKAKFDLKFEWNKDGTPDSFLKTDLVLDIGDTTVYIQDTINYTTGEYTDLVATVSNVRAG